MKVLCILPLVLLLSGCGVVQTHEINNCFDTTNTVHETSICLKTVYVGGSNSIRTFQAYANLLDEQVHSGKITEAEAEYNLHNKLDEMKNASRVHGGGGDSYNNRSHTCTYGSNVINCN